MLIVADPLQAEAALVEGRLPCPHCPGMLRPWAYARQRQVRGLPDPVTPRRALCPLCLRSQVLLPGALLPRRADATQVVWAALVAKATGRGHRQIAADLQVPASTVRRWLRATRSPAHLEWLRRRATERTYQVDRDTLNRIRPQNGPLADALTALAAAVDAIRRYLPAVTATPWALISVITGGRLLLPAPSS